MFKNILASLTGFPSDEAVLETAAQVAGQFRAHVDCLHVTFGTTEIELASALGLGLSVEQTRVSGQRIIDAAAAARKSFEDVCVTRKLTVAKASDIAVEGASFSYRETSGADLDRTIDEARIHDLTVIARDSRNVIFEPDRAGTIMLGAGRPVLVPPRKAAKTIGTKIVIAWKNKAEAARACAAAMPFVLRADKVAVLTTVEETGTETSEGSAQALVRELAWHGVKAQSDLLPFSLKPPGESILDRAYHLDADLLVMGGYGHSRLREIVFGGMTREILSECEIPVLIAH